jgi:hypothetical protein
MSNLGISKGLSSYEAEGYGSGSVSNFFGSSGGLLLKQDILEAGGDGDLINLDLNLCRRYWGKWRRLNKRYIFHLNFTSLWFSNIKEGGVDRGGIKMFSSVKLKEKAWALGLELLCLNRKDMYITGSSIGSINMEQIW